jgi:hypothetical protein
MSTKSVHQFSNLASLALAVLPLVIILGALTSGAANVAGL